MSVKARIEELVAQGKYPYDARHQAFAERDARRPWLRLRRWWLRRRLWFLLKFGTRWPK